MTRKEFIAQTAVSICCARSGEWVADFEEGLKTARILANRLEETEEAPWVSEELKALERGPKGTKRVDMEGLKGWNP